MARLDLTVDPKSEYERKLMTAEQAAGLIESGDLVWIPSTHTPPAGLGASRDAFRSRWRRTTEPQRPRRSYNTTKPAMAA